jgi:hypothetical protein
MADTSRFSGNLGAPGAQGGRPSPGSVSQTAGDVKNRMQEGAQSTLQKAGDMASDLGHRAGETLSSAASTASNIASKVGEKAEGAVSSVGEKMHDLGSTVRERGPHSGVLGSATSAVASGLESTGDYLHEQGISGMFGDVTALVRRFPIQAMLVGFGVGFLTARALRRE